MKRGFLYFTHVFGCWYKKQHHFLSEGLSVQYGVDARYVLAKKYVSKNSANNYKRTELKLMKLDIAQVLVKPLLVNWYMEVRSTTMEVVTVWLDGTDASNIELKVDALLETQLVYLLRLTRMYLYSEGTEIQQKHSSDYDLVSI